MILHRPSFFRLGLFVALVATVAAQPAHAAGAADEPEPSHPTDAGPAHAAVEESGGEHAAQLKTHPATSHDPHPAATAVGAESNRDGIISLQKLGASLSERGDADAAEIAYRQIMAAREATIDDLANALVGLARVYRKFGSLTKAAAIYEKYLKDYPAHDHVPDVLLELGRTHRALGAHQLALARFYSVLNSTLKLSSEGFVHYQMLAKTAQFEIAETHFQMGAYPEANKYFSRLRLLDLAPADRARAHFKSAYALYLGKEFEPAVVTLHSYLEQWPQDENVPEARYLLSLSLRTLGRKQEALDATLQLLRAAQSGVDPKRWSYWQRRTGNQLANEFFQAGDTLNALVIYQGLAALSPDPAWRLPITYQIALCYERMRLYDRAAVTYQSIVDGANPPPVEAALVENKSAAPEAAKSVSAELAELTRMATWRLTQLNWNEQTERHLAAIFTAGSEPAPKAPLVSSPLAPNIDSNAPSHPTAPSAHDQPGKPEPTPPNL